MYVGCQNSEVPFEISMLMIFVFWPMQGVDIHLWGGATWAYSCMSFFALERYLLSTKVYSISTLSLCDFGSRQVRSQEKAEVRHCCCTGGCGGAEQGMWGWVSGFWFQLMVFCRYI